MSARGLYEVLVTEALEEALGKLGRGLVPERHRLRDAEAADRIALHLGGVLQRAIESVPEKERAQRGLELARELIEAIARRLPKAQPLGDRPADAGEVLAALRAKQPDGEPEQIAAPLLPLLDTALLTNAPGEPRVGSQINAEIASSDRIDVLMAFIRRSGIAPLLPSLRKHCERGGALRVLTTTYTNSTEARALDELRKIGADVRVSYETGSTRLHAKAWLLHRNSGFSTAYIGSSNLTHSAQVTGLEWNVRVSGARNPTVIEKMAAVFESYWNGGDFVPYDAETFRSRAQSNAGPQIILSPIELRPEPFQERLLEQIAIARSRGHHRNLLVAATGTGKTVMAAIDYRRLREALPRARLLFVAHRKEILQQSLATFRHALRDGAFGELWVDGKRPTAFDHVFASIQSLDAAGYDDLPPDHYDVVIVDEFHHAAAASYERLLGHVRPRELLGLTATPERSDGLPILQHFDGRIAAELRLWDAIDQRRLVPFTYFGVHDDLDLRKIPWHRGKGYDVHALSNLLTGNDVWAAKVQHALQERVEDLSRMRALGFCVSVEHARYMARVFDNAGIKARAVWADTPAAEREAALADLAARRIQILFSVDLFNEGVDVPSVDTLLFLRPTDSATLFLQQLGRGLRRSDGKSHCTVLDFVGRHRTEFRWDRKLGGLLGGTRGDLQRQVEAGFPFLPAGCHMELDRVASEIVLGSLRNAIPSTWPRQVEELRTLVASGREPTLQTFLRESGLDLEDLYDKAKGRSSFSDLLDAAGVQVAAEGPHEATLRHAISRLLHVDDPERLDGWRRLLRMPSPPLPAELPVRERRLLRMLVAQLVDSVAGTPSLEEACALLWAHPQVRAELVQLFDVLAERVGHLGAPLATHPDVPLQIHGRYTRIEILAAFGQGDGAKAPTWREGVRWLKNERVDLLAFTLDKTSGAFSPTTRYRDYAINRELVHWESQSMTSADSPTGRRYRTHASGGSSILLFARERADQRAFHFLGPATFVSYEGERPMAITWKLARPLPGDLYQAFAAAVA